LAERGYRYGLDFMYFAFPNAEHSEKDWDNAYTSHSSFLLADPLWCPV